MFMRKADLETCRELKLSESVRRTEIGGIDYGMYLIGRGERLFLQKGPDALLADIFARHAIFECCISQAVGRREANSW